MKSEKPFAQSCANNQQPILEKLQTLFARTKAVLEIGSGTGQHAVHFGANLPHVTWHTSDRPEHHAGMGLWLAEADLANVRPPITLDVMATPWPVVDVDAAYTANTAHIMPWPAVCAMFRGVSELLARDGLFVIYGPFNYGGAYTSAGNARFDDVLRRSDPLSGLRDIEAVTALAGDVDFSLADDHTMPANNRLLVWRKL